MRYKKNKNVVYYNWSRYHLKNEALTISNNIILIFQDQKSFRAKLAAAR